MPNRNDDFPPEPDDIVTVHPDDTEKNAEGPDKETIPPETSIDPIRKMDPVDSNVINILLI